MVLFLVTIFTIMVLGEGKFERSLMVLSGQSCMSKEDYLQKLRHCFKVFQGKIIQQLRKEKNCTKSMECLALSYTKTESAEGVKSTPWLIC